MDTVKPKLERLGKSQTIPLTPNSNCISTPLGDAVNSVSAAFGLTAAGVTCWEATVSLAQSKFELPADFPCGEVTYQQGLAVQYQASGNGGPYLVLLSGTIVDQGQSYTYNPGVVIYDSQA